MAPVQGVVQMPVQMAVHTNFERFGVRALVKGAWARSICQIEGCGHHPLLYPGLGAGGGPALVRDVSRRFDFGARGAKFDAKIG